MSDPLLSREEIRRVTGHGWRKAQVEWLSGNGWRFAINGVGEVIVARAELEAQLVSGKAQAAKSAIRWGEVKHGRKAA